MKDREIAENTIQAPLVLKQLKEVLSDGKKNFVFNNVKFQLGYSEFKPETLKEGKRKTDRGKEDVELEYIIYV